MLSKEGVGSRALGESVVVFLVGEMGIGDLVLGAIKLVDVLDEGEFDPGGVEGPVTAVGNEELRTRAARAAISTLFVLCVLLQ